MYVSYSVPAPCCGVSGDRVSGPQDEVPPDGSVPVQRKGELIEAQLLAVDVAGGMIRLIT